jgi:hypothetical protein
MKYIIYCDESDDRGAFFSNFYGGALIRASDREAIEADLRNAKRRLQGEVKWVKICAHNEADYIAFIDVFFNFIKDGIVKTRIMFTQNINQIQHLQSLDGENEFFMLYYQFIKHAFGLRYCNDDNKETVDVMIYLDDAPDTKEKLENFKNYMSSLSTYPIFFNNKISIDRDNITEVDSKNHIILQAVDVVLGSMQFRLNELHKAISKGQRHRGRRTRAKYRVYQHINSRIRKIYPGFNVGKSTGQDDGPEVKWSHPYRHWCFVPNQSIEDLSRGKKNKK